jgi:hypothetical protein
VGDVVDLEAARSARRGPPELDQQCRECGKIFGSLAELVAHYDAKCRPAGRSHPAGRRNYR